MRILCSTQASPDEIQTMFANLKVREEAFEKCMHAERSSTSVAQNASLPGVQAETQLLGRNGSRTNPPPVDPPVGGSIMDIDDSWIQAM